MVWRHSQVPLTQNTLREGIVEMGPGEPDPRLLPVELVARAAAAALGEFGTGVIAYGPPPGPPPLRELLAARISTREGCPIHPDQLLITAGNSPGLDLVLAMLTRPGDAVLVETPTYGLALRTMRDHHVELIPVTCDEDGLDVEEAEAKVAALRAAGRRVSLLYTIPTFHNPAGVSLAAERRRRLVELAATQDVAVVEDDVYRELVYEGEAPPSLWTLAPEAPIVRLGSFSKSLSPGLRVGWLNTSSALLARIHDAGILDSGGSPSQFAACVVAGVLAGGGYDEHVQRLRASYSARRLALAAALDEYLPAGCTWRVPAGGFFLWVRLPEGLLASELLPVAEAHGVGFAPGRRFCADGDDRSMRLSFSLLDEPELREGARRLGAAIAAATRRR